MFNSALIARNYVSAIEESGLDITLPDQQLLENIHYVMCSATSYSSFEAS